MRKLFLAGAAGCALLAAAWPADAADLTTRPAPAPVAAPSAPLPVFTWTGVYIGANGGAAWTRRDDFDPFVYQTLYGVTFINGFFHCGVGPAFPCDHGRGAFTAGGQIGYNWQINPWVLGVEGDFNWVARGHRGDCCANGLSFIVPPPNPRAGTYTAFGFDDQDNRWFATARGRLGYALDRLLFYVTGGAAFRDDRDDDVAFVTQLGGATVFYPGAGDRGHKVGWSAGGGFDYALTDNIFMRFEYLHLGFGGHGDGIDPVASTVLGTPVVFSHGQDQDIDVVRAAVNVRLGSLFGVR